jgi:hypothetical protein
VVVVVVVVVAVVELSRAVPRQGNPRAASARASASGLAA